MIRPAPGVPIEQQPEAWCLRACVWAEARGEPVRGMLAVAWVIRNRALKRDTSLKAEILRPWQFSSFNTDDPNRAKMLEAHVKDTARWSVVDAVCTLFEGGDTNDPTKGATHYYVVDMDNPPKWGRGHADWIEHIVLSKHVFGSAG